jgi:hypothetical protein
MYQKTELKGVEQPIIKRLSDNAFIPFAEGNTDYQEYLKWLAEGNTPLPADAQPE